MNLSKNKLNLNAAYFFILFKWVTKLQTIIDYVHIQFSSKHHLGKVICICDSQTVEIFTEAGFEIEVREYYQILFILWN